MRPYRVLVVVCLVAGVLLRARGYLFSSDALWGDEAAWAIRLKNTSLLAPSIRPVGFMLVARFLVACFGMRDIVLRFLPWAASIGSLLLTVPLAEALLPNRAGRLLLIGTMAFHPVAIDYSKEFKPYSSSLFLHLLCVFFAIRFLRDRRTRTLCLGVLTGFLGIWFAQDLIFALPGYYLVTGILAWRSRERRQLVLLVVGAASTFALIVLLYFLFWRAVDVGPGAADTAFWGAKYDVFHLAGTGEGLLHWLGRKYLELAAFPAARRDNWQGHTLFQASVMGWLSAGYAALWILLHGAGLVVLVRQRRYGALTLFLAPVVTLLVFNQLGLWPFAVFRTNLFLLAYVCPLAAFGIDAFPPLTKAEALPLVIAVVLPLVAFERDWHEHKRSSGESAFFEVTRDLVKLQGPHRGEGEPLVLDHVSCTVFHYYLKMNPDYAKLRKRLDKRFITKCFTEEEALPEAEREAKERRVFLVLSYPEAHATTRAQVANLSNVVDRRTLNEGSDELFELAPSVPQ